ncbi:MAG: hypothetical protein ABIE94_04905 [archaeon]
MMNKRANEGIGLIAELIMILLVILVLVGLLIGMGIGPVRKTKDCEKVHHGRCIPRDEGCHPSEVQAPWDCNNPEEVCCLGREPYEDDSEDDGTISPGELEISEGINVYHGEDTLIPISGSTLQLKAMKDTTLKVFVEAEGDDVGKCTIYIMDEDKNSITDAEGRRMRFENKDCANQVFKFDFKPPSRYIGKTLEMDVIVFLAGHEGSEDQNHWYDSSKTYLVIVQDSFFAPIALDVADCQLGNANEVETFLNLNNRIVETIPGPNVNKEAYNCYYTTMASSKSCSDKAMGRNDFCQAPLNNVPEPPFTLCTGIYYRDDAGEDKCFYLEEKVKFMPAPMVDVVFSSRGIFYFYCQGDECLGYTYAYGFTEPGGDCYHYTGSTTEATLGPVIVPLDSQGKRLCGMIRSQGTSFQVYKDPPA